MMDVYINVLMLIDEAIELFEEEKYSEEIEKLNLAWDKIQDKNTLVSEQLKIQLFLSYCYLKQSKRTKIADEEEKLLELAVEHIQKWLKLADKKRDILQQISAQLCLGMCRFTQAKKTKNPNKRKTFFKQASEDFLTVDEQIPQLNDDKRREKLNKKFIPI